MKFFFFVFFVVGVVYLVGWLFYVIWYGFVLDIVMFNVIFMCKYIVFFFEYCFSVVKFVYCRIVDVNYLVNLINVYDVYYIVDIVVGN